ncbi:hypothetical protein [Spirosoma sordidisoli]|uniref:Uncharacterized protein n=1 Tax=Spirosoma sordidisoli TaxID=2502893 RepID=A0A4Q2UNT2_9BACT|nr:hypothetical protein [Spirosoma sordidisoli]RYC71367.1 hypothetical protein EQG79_04280 [Spirosoma sordidisoli]
MNTLTQRLLVGLMLTIFFASCSRPVAYFQKSPRESFAKTPAVQAPVADASTPVSGVNESVVVATPAQPIAQANAALDQMDAMVRNDAKLATDKTVQKRLNKVRTMLTSAAQKSTLTPAATTAPQKKAGLVERLMIKKLNKKINRQLAPSNPEKAMANTGILAAGAVAVIIGLLILLLGGSGTLGVILLLAGAIVLLVGLLA